nr:integumentary mucin C.1-like [Rhipicephalus microplus]
MASTDGTLTRRQALQHASTPGSNPSIIKGRSFRDALSGTGDTTSDATPCPATSAPVVPTTTTTAPLSVTAQPAPTVVEKRSTVTQTPRTFSQPPVPVTVNTGTTM